MLTQEILAASPCFHGREWLGKQALDANADELLDACPWASWICWYFERFYDPDAFEAWDLLDAAVQTLYLQACFDAEHGPDSDPGRLAALNNYRFWAEASDERRKQAETDYTLSSLYERVRGMDLGSIDFWDDWYECAESLDTLPGGVEAMREAARGAFLEGE